MIFGPAWITSESVALAKSSELSLPVFPFSFLLFSFIEA